MNQRLEALQDESLRLALEEEERKHLRDLLIAHIDKNPAPESDTLSYHSQSAPKSKNTATIIGLLLILAAAIVFTLTRILS